MGIRRRLGSILWRVPTEEEVRDELAHHVELRTRELCERGWSPDAARREAERRVTGTAPALLRLAEERNRSAALRERLDELRQDVAYALRRCRQRPGFTAAAVLTLALGIGATTAIFSVVHAVVLRPFPFSDPDRVLFVYTTWREGRTNTSVGNFDYLRRHTRTFEHLAAAEFLSVNLADGGVPERVVGMRVTWDYFRVLGIAPLHGRTFTADEDRPGGERVVVLSHRLWLRRFGGDPSIVGTSIRLSGEPHDVVGIMPPALDEIAGAEQLWVPVAFTPERLALYDEHGLQMFGLRRADATLAQVNEDLAGAAAGLRRDHAEFNLDRGAEARVLAEFSTAPFTTRLAVLLGAVVLVLLIACGNVANLMLASLAARGRELAIRAAIGAGRGRIVRQVVTESVVLSALGGAAGILVARWMLPALVSAAPAMQRIDTAAVNGPALALAIGLVLATAGLVGVLPAWQATRGGDLRQALGEGKGTSGSGVRPRVRQALVGIQAALVLLVLAAAALLVRSAIHLQQVPIGFDVSGALVARVGLVGPEYDDPQRVKLGFQRLIDALESAPGIAGAALDSQPPLVGGGSTNGLIPEGAPLSMEGAINSRSHFVTPAYFDVLGLPLRAGRAFTDADVRSAPLVVIVNETLARRAFGTGSAIGKRMACCEGEPGRPVWKTIVGVAADVRSRGPAGEPVPEFYLPMVQVPDAAWSWVQNTLTVMIRPAGGVEPAAMAPVIRDAVAQVDPSMPIFGVGTFDEALRLTLLQARFNTLLMSTLALAGLVLAALGIYSVIAWLVSQRAREIGVRMALGATTGRVVREIALHGLRPVAVGLAAGLAGAIATTRVLEAQLFQVGARDPWTLAGVALLLLAVAGGAAVVPAWRASRIDPAAALHDG